MKRLKIAWTGAIAFNLLAQKKYVKIDDEIRDYILLCACKTILTWHIAISRIDKIYELYDDRGLNHFYCGI